MSALTVMATASLPRAAAASIAATLLGMAFVDATVRRVPSRCRLARNSQVPQGWAAQRSRRSLGLSFGALLGMGFATKTPIMAPQVLVAAILLSGAPVAAASFVAFGATRSLAAIVVQRRHISPEALLVAVDRTFPAVRCSVAVSAIAVAVAAVVGGGA